MKSNTAMSQDPGVLRLEVFDPSQILYEADGPTRGYAQADFEGIPRHLPGYLDFAPLRLCAVGALHPFETVPMHEHSNIDNLTFVRSGSLSHRDSMGNQSETRAGQFYLLSAGSGVSHEEQAGAEGASVFLLWLKPDLEGGASEFVVSDYATDNEDWRCVAHGGASAEPGGPLPLRCDASVHLAEVGPGQERSYTLKAGRRAYLLVQDGTVRINGAEAGDGARVQVRAGAQDAELLLRSDDHCLVTLVNLAPE